MNYWFFLHASIKTPHIMKPAEGIVDWLLLLKFIETGVVVMSATWRTSL